MDAKEIRRAKSKLILVHPYRNDLCQLEAFFPSHSALWNKLGRRKCREISAPDFIRRTRFCWFSLEVHERDRMNLEFCEYEKYLLANSRKSNAYSKRISIHARKFHLQLVGAKSEVSQKIARMESSIDYGICSI